MGTTEKAVALLEAAGVATHVHKALPQPLSAEGLMNSVDGVDPAASAGIISALRSKGYLKSRGEFCVDLERANQPNASIGVFTHINAGLCQTLNHTGSSQDNFLIPYHVEAAWGAIDSACRHGGALCQDAAVKAVVRGPTAPAIFEELKVCEGVHTATREGLDEALDFLIAKARNSDNAPVKLRPRKVSPKKASASDLSVPSSFLKHDSTHKNAQFPFLAPTALPTINPPMLSLNTHAMLNGIHHKYVPGDNQWGFPMANSMIKLDGDGQVLRYDDIEYGMNHLWEDLGIWTTQEWHGIQFLQNPADAFAIQELLWNEKPDMVVEIGTHKGASALYFAEIMHDYNPNSVWVTIDPAFQNSAAARMVAAQGPLAKSIVWINGLSNDAVNVVPQVKKLAEGRKKVFVIQDGQHAASQVLADFALYDGLVTVGGYFIVQDTILDRTQPLQPGPLAGVNQWLSGYGRGRYVADKRYEHELWSTNHNGYLRKIA
eukprot:gnl/MRDRNA2_/MRDRNA2_98564_c0_seq1.p1 gnl/MRDRNA2_/MRDRNA2_98564_c0~~gnl/MRDRNA2_/MRDRNA2_98564_c0_seq1.p1  ORF type:complete len:517 (+),score=118.47 gnl/MRDRNA2_/MRDRNA2_98564_c0_seq1:85-1551(+)